MKAILFCNFVNNINGALIDVIEYYLCMVEHNINVKLLILNYNPQFEKSLNELIEDRYNTDDLNYKKNILGISKIFLLKTKFSRILITDYSTINSVKGLLILENNDSKIIIVSDLHTDNPSFIINHDLYPKGCVVYYGEMPFVYKDIQYNHKFLFSRFKKISTVDQNILVHSPKNKDYNFLKSYENILKTKKILIKTDFHKKHFFELFDTFIYYHANKWFDPRPRLMHECSFYKKEIFYINKPNCIDGSYYRYQDLNKNGLNNRWLDKNDEVIMEFL